MRDAIEHSGAASPRRGEALGVRLSRRDGRALGGHRGPLGGEHGAAEVALGLGVEPFVASS